MSDSPVEQATAAPGEKRTVDPRSICPCCGKPIVMTSRGVRHA